MLMTTSIATAYATITNGSVTVTQTVAASCGAPGAALVKRNHRNRKPACFNGFDGSGISSACSCLSLSTPTSTVYTSTATTITQVITVLVCSSLSPFPHSLSFWRILRCDFHLKTTMSLGRRSASISAAYEHEFELSPQHKLDDCSAITLEEHGQPQVCN